MLQLFKEFNGPSLKTIERKYKKFYLSALMSIEWSVQYLLKSL